MNNKNPHVELVTKALKKVISEFECKTSGRASVQDIAEKSKCGLTTIYDIKRGAINSLSIKKALEISTRLGGPTELKELLKSVEQVDPKEAEQCARNIPHMLEYSPTTDEFDRFIGDERYTQLIWAAYSANHITRREALRQWGEDVLETLLSKGVLKEEDGVIKGQTQSAGCDPISIYRQLGIAYQTCGRQSDSDKGRWVGLQTKSVKPEFLEKWKIRLQETMEQFNKEADIPENRGSVHIFLGTMLGHFLDLSHNGGESK